MITRSERKWTKGSEQNENKTGVEGGEADKKENRKKKEGKKRLGVGLFSFLFFFEASAGLSRFEAQPGAYDLPLPNRYAKERAPPTNR